MRASLAVALIAKNAGHTLGPCLDSLRPHVEQIVVGVDELTTDNTADVARDHGADLVTSVVVSEQHECQMHGKILAQHFARAREQSFVHLSRDCKWWLWIDADDVLEGGELLAKRLNEMQGDPPIGFWLPYHYATVDMKDRRETTTLFHRERVLRSDLTWKWHGRVHETVSCDLPGPWVGMEDVIIRHQSGGHKAGNSAMRNLLLLEIDLEENPRDERAIFYMGNQYFAMGEWEEAANWYERLGQSGCKNPYELWQAYCYQALALMKLGDSEGAKGAAWAALDAVPNHPEPYFHLASAYLAQGEPEKSLKWINFGRAMEKPPFFVFKNPLDYTYNNRVAAAEALGAMGHVPEARAELEAAFRVIPDERIGENIRRYRGLEEAADVASSFVNLAKGKSDAEIVRLWEALDLPPEVRSFGRCRDVAIPAILRQRPNTQPRVVFWCGRSLEEWAPPSLNGSGIGGSETAVVEIARRFAADGWRVDVYNNAGRYEGVYDEVAYLGTDRLQHSEQTDLFVSWRSPGSQALLAEARGRVLWCHDLNYGGGLQQEMHSWDKVLGVSAWHAAYLRRAYGLSATGYVPNGINLERFSEPVKKIPFRCVYASSPDRGLNLLLEAWPRIVAAEPSAELHIAYGWENYDKGIAAGNAHMAAFKQAIERKMLGTPRVVWRGRLPQNELARLYSESYAWLYPATFLEVSCISAMEAMAGGAVPITSRVGALPETIGDAGVLVDGYPQSRSWLDFYTHIATGVLMAMDVRIPLQLAGRERVKELTWDRSYGDFWKPMVAGLLEGERVREEVLA